MVMLCLLFFLALQLLQLSDQNVIKFTDAVQSVTHLRNLFQTFASEQGDDDNVFDIVAELIEKARIEPADVEQVHNHEQFYEMLMDKATSSHKRKLTDSKARMAWERLLKDSNVQVKPVRVCVFERHLPPPLAFHF